MNREVYYSEVLEEVLKGPHRVVKTRYKQSELQDLKLMSLLGSEGGVLWGSWTKAGLINSRVKSGVLVSSGGRT